MKSRPNEADQPSLWEPWITGEATKRWPPPDAAPEPYCVRRPSRPLPTGYDAQMVDDSTRSRKSSEDLLREAKEGFGSYDPAHRPNREEVGGMQPRGSVELPYEPPSNRIERARHAPPPVPPRRSSIPAPPAHPGDKPRNGSARLAYFLLGLGAFFWITTAITLLQGDEEPFDLILGTITITSLPLFFGIRLLLQRRRG